MRFIFYRTAVILALVLGTLGGIRAQFSESGLVPKIEYQGYLGGILKHRSSMKDMGNSLYMGNELRLGFETSGNKYWQQAHNFPFLGLGFYMANFNNEIVGKPLAFFGFMELPFHRKPNSYFSTNWSLGMIFNLNEYHALTNPENIAIGSDKNVYVDFSLFYRYKISQKVQLGTGIKIQHFSNGALTSHNLGLNLFSGTLSIAYYPKGPSPKFKTDATPQKHKEYEITPVVSGAWREKDSLSNSLYFCSNLSLSLSKRMNEKRTLGFGFDYFYQPYLASYYQDQSQVRDKDLMSYAGFISSEFIVNRFRLITQLGFYFYQPVDFGRAFYERVGLRCYISNYLFANISLKAHGAKAEFIEWGMGYNF